MADVDNNNSDDGIDASHVCPICGEHSDQPHQIHYGGVACFSCRAFFRRAHQKTRDPKFVCKTGGNCQVTLKTRRKCQKCRYQLCIKSGMRPEAVLTDDQKKIRFRNMIRKKASRKTEAFVSRETISDSNGSSDDDDDDDDRRRRRNVSNNSQDLPEETNENIVNNRSKGAPVKIEVNISPGNLSSVSSPDPFSIQYFETSLPAVMGPNSDDDEEQQMAIRNAAINSRRNNEILSSTLTTPAMSPGYINSHLHSTTIPSPFYSNSHSPSTNTTRVSLSSRSHISSHSSSSRSSSSVSPYSSPLMSSSHRSYISSPGCCQSSTSSASTGAPKISIGGFNKKKMAVSAQRMSIFPCFNYCPIASTAHLGKPKQEGSNDCECGGEGGSGGSGGGCCGSSGGGGEDSSSGRTSKVRLIAREPRPQRSSCPMMGDIENWPPAYECEDVEVSYVGESNRSSEKSGSVRHGSGKAIYGSDESSAQDLRVSKADGRSSGHVTFAMDSPKGISSNGKIIFDESSRQPGDENLFQPPATDDDKSEERYKVGAGPYEFDVDSAPPAPSMRGRVEVERLIHAYNISGTQMEVDPEFVKRLVAFHRGYMVMPRTLLKSYIVALAQQFRHFAIQHQRFILLSKSDQRKLLARNSALFIQYLLGKYFSAPTGEDQIHWLLGPRAPPASELVDVQRISVHEFNASVKLFRKGTFLDMYEEFANRLWETNTEHKFNPVMAHFFLFCFDSSDRFLDPETVAELHADSFKMCPHSRHYLLCSQQPNITGVLETCEAMASFFAINTIWNDLGMDSDDFGSSGSESSSNETSIRHQPAVPYTQDEENWFCRQMAMFNDAYSAVPLGEDIIKELVMYAYDVPISKHFMPVTLSVVNERFRRIICMHSEVAALTAIEQARLCEGNTMNAVALYIAKMESCRNAAQQFQFAFGTLDDSIFERDYSHVIKVSKMRKLSLFETNKSTNLLTDRMLCDVERLVAKIAPIITDFETFKLLCLITLFTGVGDTLPLISRLRNRYLTVLRRRPFRPNKKMRLDPEASTSSGGSEFYSNAVYKQFTACLCDIQELAALMQKLRSSLPESFERAI